MSVAVATTEQDQEDEEGFVKESIRREKVSLWAYEHSCKSGRIEAMIDVCVAASDLAGQPYQDPEQDWPAAIADLKDYYKLLRREETTGLTDHAYKALGWLKADGIFSERFCASIIRFENWIEADQSPILRDEEEKVATATKKKNTTSVIPLRIEKRLKVTIDIEVDSDANEAGGFIFSISGFDSKQKEELSEFDPHEFYKSKDSATLAGFDIAYSWITDLREKHGDRARYNAVLACIQEQAEKIQPGWTPPEIPETEEDAEAKEQLVDARPIPEDEILKLNPFLKSLDGPLPFDQTLTVPRNCILPSPDNPRDHFALKPLQELAATIKEHGQQQPITVFWNLAKELEIIDGERRFRASEQAELPTVSIIIRDVTLADAAELRGVANLQREDLTLVEEAKWHQQLIDKCNYTQRTLSERLGISQAKLAESLSLLKLPEAWQELLTTHVITPTMARELTPWREREKVLDKILDSVTEWQALPASFKDEAITASQFKKWKNTAIEKCSKPLASWQCPFRVTDKNRDDLDIAETPRGKRAFNTTLWNKLAKAARDRQKKRNQTPSSATVEKLKELPILEHRLTNHQNDWLTEQIALKIEKLPKKEKLLPFQLLMMFSLTENFSYALFGELPFLKTLCDGSTPQNDLDHGRKQNLDAPLWRVMQKIDAKNRDQVLRELLLCVLRQEGENFPIDYLFAIAIDLGVDFDTFRPSKELLNDYTEESLREMPAYSSAAEKHTEECLKRQDKEGLLYYLIEAWQPGEFPPGWMPKYVGDVSNV